MASKLFVFNEDNSKLYTVICSTLNTQIIDSYEIKSIKGMKSIINKIKNQLIETDHSDFAVFNRTLTGMIIEWRAHNLLYSLGIYKNKTKNVDLDLNIKQYNKILYFILSCLYFRY